MPTVVQEFTGNDASVVRAYARILEHIKKMEAGLAGLVKKSKEVEGEQHKLEKAAQRVATAILSPQEKHAQKTAEINKLYDKQLLSLAQQQRAHKKNDEWLKSQADNQGKGYNYAAQYTRLLGYQLASYLSINAAMQLGLNMLREREELQKRAKDTAVSLSETQRDMYLNLGVKTTPAQRDRVDAAVQGLASKYRPEGGAKSVYSDVSNALSAGQGNPEVALGAVETALQFAPDNAEDRRFIAGAIIDLQSATGSKDPLENLGLLAGMGETTRIPTWRRIAKNLSTGVVGVKKYGGTAQQAASLVTALTAASKDPMGEESATAAISMAYQLARMVPEKDFYETELDPRTNRYRRRLVAKGTGMADTFSRITYLQQHPKEMERVLNSLSVEKKQMAGVKDIIQGVGIGQESLTTARAAVDRPLKDLAGDVQKYIGVMGGSFNQQVGEGSRSQEQVLTELQTSIAGKERALSGLFSREQTTAQLAESGVGYLGQLVQNINWYGEFGDNQYAANIAIKRRISDLRRNTFGTSRLFGDAPPEDVQQAKILEEYLKRQNELAEQLKNEIHGLKEEYAKERSRPNPTAVQNNRNQHGEGGR